MGGRFEPLPLTLYSHTARLTETEFREPIEQTPVFTDRRRPGLFSPSRTGAERSVDVVTNQTINKRRPGDQPEHWNGPEPQRKDLAWQDPKSLSPSCT